MNSPPRGIEDAAATVPPLISAASTNVSQHHDNDLNRVDPVWVETHEPMVSKNHHDSSVIRDNLGLAGMSMMDLLSSETNYLMWDDATLRAWSDLGLGDESVDSTYFGLE